MGQTETNELPESNPATTTPAKGNLLTMATIVQLLRAVKARRAREAAGQPDATDNNPPAPAAGE
jgi:hypothetical protein